MYVFYVWFSFEFQISLQCISMHLKSPIQANSMISSFYRWENWGTERLNNLLKLTCTEIQIPCGGQELLILGFNMAACTFSKMIHYAHVTFYRRLSRSSNSWCLPLDHQLFHVRKFVFIHCFVLFFVLPCLYCLHSHSLLLKIRDHIWFVLFCSSCPGKDAAKGAGLETFSKMNGGAGSCSVQQLGVLEIEK